MPDRERIRLQHMLDAALKARQFISGRTRADLDSDEMLTLSLTRLLEILGEAAKAVPDEIKQQRPDIPWRQISGMRNRLIHGYYHVDLDIVWAIVTQDLPPLVEALQELLSER